MGGPIEIVDMWDWYDGLVLGLVRLPPATGVFLASTVAWSLTAERRAFCCVPLSEAQAVEVHALARGPWEQSVARIRAYCRRLGGKASIVVLDEKANQVHAEYSVDLESVVPDLMGDIEAAMAPKRQHWLSPPG